MGDLRSSEGDAGPIGVAARYPLLAALIGRRSRRFAPGMRLGGGPLAFASEEPPRPLSLEEEAALAFAACGITGHALAELPFASGDEPDGGGGGNVIINFAARTVASGEAAHCVAVIVINDGGAWLLRRPQDYPRAEIGELVQLAHAGQLVELYQRARVRIADGRIDVPRDLRYVPAFNHYSANRPGTTVFLPIADLSTLYINILLAAFSEEYAAFVLDDRRNFRPAGIGQFARSKGGYLHDDPRDERVGTVSLTEGWLGEFTAIEQGGMLQNLGLMTQALGLGGFPFFAAHPYIWPQALGFRMEQPSFSATIGAGPVLKGLLRALRRDIPVPTAVGLERNGEVLLRPFCPPYSRTMEEAVVSFVETKYRENAGIFRDGGAATAWRDGAAVQAGIPRYSDRTIAAVIAYCTYIHRHYGRFPAAGGPFRTVLAYQAHHLDPAFYEQFYRPEALTETQRRRVNSAAG
ncbi:MAG: hypothetical protein U0841_05395 [Chloroflexia bacterium]